MQAVIMAGGKGERMKPLTDTLQKAMILLDGKPILEHGIRYLARQDVDKIIVCAGYRGEQVQKFVSSHDFGIPVSFSQEQDALGSAGGMRLIADMLDDEFFVMYSDVLSAVDLRKMKQFHDAKNADATLVVHASDHPQDSTVVSVGSDGMVEGFVEKPGDDWKKHGNLTNAALYILKKNVLDFIPTGMSDFARDVFPAMVAAGKRVYAYDTTEFIRDVGTPGRLKEAEQMLKAARQSGPSDTQR